MQIIKTEKIVLSEAESKAWDLLVICLEGIMRNSENPEILKYVDKVLDGLGDLVDYLEEN